MHSLLRDLQYGLRGFRKQPSFAALAVVALALGIGAATTIFSVIDKVRAGEEIPLSKFTEGEDDITRQVIEYGGLFPFNVARMQKKVFLPPITTGSRAMTVAEKIFARHMLNQQNEPGVVGVGRERV